MESNSERLSAAWGSIMSEGAVYPNRPRAIGSIAPYLNSPLGQLGGPFMPGGEHFGLTFR
jgi:hypothetical protein